MIYIIATYMVIGLTFLYYDFKILKDLGVWDVELSSMADQLIERAGDGVPLSREDAEKSIIMGFMVVYAVAWPIVILFKR